MPTEKGKVVLGALLLVASTAIILATGQLSISLHPVWGSLAALGLAAGALFVGTSGDSRPV